MVATVVSLVASWSLFGRLLAMPVVTAVLVVVFGGLTFWLDDPRFIMVKPTIINLRVCRRAARRAGDAPAAPQAAVRRGLQSDRGGWRKLERALGAVLLDVGGAQRDRLAQLLEATWVNFKVFGILPLTLVFAMAQIGLIKRYEAKTEA